MQEWNVFYWSLGALWKPRVIPLGDSYRCRRKNTWVKIYLIVSDSPDRSGETVGRFRNGDAWGKRKKKNISISFGRRVQVCSQRVKQFVDWWMVNNYKNKSHPKQWCSLSLILHATKLPASPGLFPQSPVFFSRGSPGHQWQNASLLALAVNFLLPLAWWRFFCVFLSHKGQTNEWIKKPMDVIQLLFIN